MTRLKRLWAAVQATGPFRGYKRYGSHRGNLLAGGVTYFAFLSIFPALALAFTIFGILLRGHPEWLEQITAYLSKTLPGFIQDKTHPDGLIALKAPGGTTLGITGLVGLVGLLWAGLGWLSALRDGVRTIFEAQGSPGNFVLAKLRDIGVMILFGLGIVVSAVVTTVANAVASGVAHTIGLGGQGWILTLVGIVISAALDAFLVALILRLLSGVDLPWPGLRNGAIVGGIGLTVIKVLGTRLIAGTTSDPIYGTIALTVGLLVWLNFISRIVLIAAAVAANDLDERTALDSMSEAVRTKATEGPEPHPEGLTAGSLAATAAARDAQGLPTFGPRAADRTTLAAGAVLGVVTAAGLGAVSRGVSRIVRGR